MREVWVRLPGGHECRMRLDEGGRGTLPIGHEMTGRELFGRGRTAHIRTGQRLRMRVVAATHNGGNWIIYSVEVLSVPAAIVEQNELFGESAK